MSIKIIDLNQTYKIIKKKLNLKINKVLNSQKFILGEEVENLENSLSKYLNVKYSLGVSSGTDALILALMACDIGKGDEVITPAFNNIADLQSILSVGGKIVFSDVDKSLCLDPSKLEKLITKKTRAIIVCDYGMRLANHNKIKLIAINNTDIIF